MKWKTSVLKISLIPKFSIYREKMAFFTRRGVSVPELPNEQQDKDIPTMAGTSVQLSAQIACSMPSKNSSKTSSLSSVLDMKQTESITVTSEDGSYEFVVVDRNLGVEV